MAGRVGMWIVMLCVVTEYLVTASQVVSSQHLEHMKNVAGMKNCSMSSRHAELGFMSGNCSAAINGNNDTHFDLYNSPPNCIHTSCDDFQPFWSVDLGNVFSIHRIIIYGREGLETRMKCVQVWIDKHILYSYSCTGYIDVKSIIHENLPQRGQVVKITKNPRSPQDDCAPLINICEVQVWVCTAGWWGRDCQHQCSARCQGAGQATGQSTDEENYCDSDNGTCLKGCVSGYWGDTCTRTCGAGCDSRGCSQSDGTCNCRPGWEPSMCQICSPLHWGSNCSPCGTGCTGTCDAISGTCRCKDGWTGTHCTECAVGRYGLQCTETCGSCADLHDCNNVTGRCLSCKTGFNGPFCKDCSEGHYNMSNDCQNTCGRGCNNTCSRTDGTCQCRPGWQPPLCQDNYYNMSNDCVTCGEGCDNTCNRTVGTCQCQPDWQPPLCQNMTSSNDDKEAWSGCGPVAGIAVGCAIVFFILGVLTGFYLRRSRSHQTSSTRGSLDNTYMTGDLATSSTHIAEQPATTSSEDRANNGVNVYDELKSRNEDNTAAYTSLNFQNKSKESAVPSDYINTRKMQVNYK